VELILHLLVAHIASDSKVVITASPAPQSDICIEHDVKCKLKTANKFGIFAFYLLQLKSI
jgi:hypothetical protein